jgi:hypothetical protein
VVTINLGGIIVENDITCEFRENYFAIYTTAIYICFVIEERRAINNIDKTILNDTIALEVNSSA